MSTHNVSFYEDLTKIIFFQLSSNMHLISSSGEIFKKIISELSSNAALIWSFGVTKSSLILILDFDVDFVRIQD